MVQTKDDDYDPENVAPYKRSLLEKLFYNLAEASKCEGTLGLLSQTGMVGLKQMQHNLYDKEKFKMLSSEKRKRIEMRLKLQALNRVKKQIEEEKAKIGLSVQQKTTNNKFNLIFHRILHELQEGHNPVDMIRFLYPKALDKPIIRNDNKS